MRTLAFDGQVGASNDMIRRAEGALESDQKTEPDGSDHDSGGTKGR